MAVLTGQLSSYTNTEPQKRVITDRILMADPMEFPLMKALGINAGKFNLVNEPGKKYEWLEDEYAPTQDLVVEGAEYAIGDTTLTVANGEYFHKGDVIQIDDEFLYVSSISGDDLTVIRGHGGSTAAAHDDSSVVHIRSQARIEGADASDSPSTVITTDYNYSFILHGNVEVTRTNALLKRYGIPDMVDREIDKKMNELMRFLTMKPYYGKRAAGSTTTARDCGGFDTFITTNLYAMSGARLTRAKIEEANRDIYDAGATPNLLVTGAFNQQLISDMFEGYVQTMRSETMGGVIIKRIQTGLGNVLDILVDRYCPADKVYLLTSDQVGFIPIDDFFFEDLGKVGDTAAYGQIIGEYGFIVQWEDAHAIISGTATS